MSTPTDTKPEETPEPVEKAGPVVPHPEADEHGWCTSAMTTRRVTDRS